MMDKYATVVATTVLATIVLATTAAATTTITHHNNINICKK